MARRDGSRVQLISRNGYDLTYRFPSVAAAIAALPVRSCLIDGEAIVCNGDGLLFFNSSATTVAEMPLRSVRSR
jgi:bifunctional non-homologous end joining protein LigD